MKKHIIGHFAGYYFTSLTLILVLISCQNSVNQANEATPQLNTTGLIGTTWRVQNTQINNQTADILGFQNQVEIKFLANGKGTVTYLNKELGIDSQFEWEVSEASKTLIIKENQKMKILEITDFQAKTLAYRFEQDGKTYQFNLKSK